MAQKPADDLLRVLEKWLNLLEKLLERGELEKFLDHPLARSLGDILSQPEKDQGVAIALNIADQNGIPKRERPFFKGMRNEEIWEWIAQHCKANPNRRRQ